MVSSVKSIKKSFDGLCGPAKFYIVLTFIGLGFYLFNMTEHRNHLNTNTGIMIQMVMAVIWTIVLNWICSLKYGVKVAWLLVFLPLLLFISMMVIIFYLLHINKSVTNKKLPLNNNRDDDLAPFECESCRAGL